MAENPDAPATPATPAAPKISTTSSKQAAFIYFDGVSCVGTHSGAFQIELAANVLMPVSAGVRVEIVQTAHLRCTPAAAADLRGAIDKALQMLQQGAQQAAAPAPGSKPN